ncbi:MAG: 30S ribosomal protein S17 [Solirubrobacteraceae bacterium]|jgi:small subunit ribosomal protein S17
MADELEPEAADAAAAGAEEVDVVPSEPDTDAVAEGDAAPEAAAVEPETSAEPEAGADSDAEPEAAAVEPEAPPQPEAVADEAQAAPAADDAEDGPQAAEAESDAPEDAPEAGAAPAAPPAAPKPEPVAVLAPKERRRLKRAAKEPAPRGPVSPEDRQAERNALRAKNAKARRGERLKSRAAKPASEVAPPTAIEHAVGRPRARQGIVTSDKAAKTITVRVDTSRRHRRYKKIVRSSKTLHAHDEHNEAHEGDLVRVVETRPLSATKRWRLLEVLERAK